MGSFWRVKTMFAERFEPDGDGYLFRARSGGAGYRLTAAERDELVARFAWRYLLAGYGFGVVGALAIGAVIFLFLDRGRAFVDAAVYATVIAIGAPLTAVFFWLWDAPVRHVRGRAVDVPALGEAEAQRRELLGATWAQFGAAAFGVGVLVWLGLSEGMTFCLLLAGALALFVFVQAVRKWRFERG